MNGAESLLATMVGAGVDTCFANPGTSEMHFLAAVDRAPGLKCVLTLFEGVATGAADGYFRMTDRPAATLLHLGPGFANGMANLHNARRAGSGILNVVGDHATAHLQHDAPLTSDLMGMARTLSHWVHRSDTSMSVASDVASAIAHARARKAAIATLVLPGDVAWGPSPGAAVVTPLPDRELIDNDALESAAKALLGGEPALLVLGGRALRAASLDFAGRIAAKTGCRTGAQFFSARIERGAGRVSVERIPYSVDPAVAFLKGFRHLITIETNEPVAFFSYPDKPSLLKAPGAQVHALCAPGGNGFAALEALCARVGALNVRALMEPLSPTRTARGAITPQSVADVLCAGLPEHCILVDESLTTGRETYALTAGAAPHDTIQNMGGSIGFSPPVATGAAIACRDRKVVSMTGDGSAMYTIQSLWTQAREGLDVTTIIFANRRYQILNNEALNMGAGNLGPKALELTSIDRPEIDFVALAKGMGVPGKRVASAEDFAAALRAAVAAQGPKLIEVVL
ncbi:MAG: acetolactate synthase large subunit [Beijerinckiaceae bacterium]|nr:acetolactate synthase large subunit [Beijerinckiaceae bacterium]